MIHTKCAATKETKKLFQLNVRDAIVMGGVYNFTIYFIPIIVAACVLLGSVAVAAPIDAIIVRAFLCNRRIGLS